MKLFAAVHESAFGTKRTLDAELFIAPHSAVKDIALLKDGRLALPKPVEPAVECSAGWVASIPKPGLRRFLKLSRARLVPVSGCRQTDDGAAYKVAAIAGRPATGKPDVSRAPF